MDEKDYLTINQFAKLSNTEVSTLRYWDEIGLFSPAQRDPQNNYRYYVPPQIIALNFITVLSNLRVPLKKINQIGGARSPEIILDLIEQQELLMDMEMQTLRERYSIIHTRRGLIKQGLNADVDHISLVTLDERPIIHGTPSNFRENEPFYEPFMRFCKEAVSLRINLSYPIGGFHKSLRAFVEKPAQPENWFSVDPTSRDKMPAGEYMVGYARGYYGDMGDLPERLTAFAKERSLQAAGPVYEIYLHDEVCQKDPSQYLVQICVAV